MEAMKACCGQYSFDGSLLFTVFMEADRLMSQIPGQPAVELIPEGPYSYFNTEVAAQFVFEKGGSAAASSMTLHQNGFEQIARRIDEATANALIAKLKARTQADQPHPDSQQLVIKMIEGQCRGQPRTDLMGQELAVATLEQNDAIKREFAQLGTFQKLEFLAVTAEGWDAYRAHFKNGELDISVFIGADGKISGALLQPPKSESFWRRLRETSR